MVNPIEIFPGALVKTKGYGILEVLAVGYEKIVATNKHFYIEAKRIGHFDLLKLRSKITEILTDYLT